MGSRVVVTARSRVVVTARLREVVGSRVVCDVEARSRFGLIGEGSVTQVILPRAVLRRRFAQFGGGADGEVAGSL